MSRGITSEGAAMTIVALGLYAWSGTLGIQDSTVRESILLRTVVYHVVSY